jgi:hypothetical protein
MRRNVRRSFENKSQIGTAILIERCRDANHNRFDFAHAAKIRAGLEMFGFNHRANRFGRDMIEVAAPGMNRIDL